VEGMQLPQNQHEERVKRIPNQQQQAESKAEQNWIEINPDVQKQIKQVGTDGNRKSYDTVKKRKYAEISPSPNRLSKCVSWEEVLSSASEYEDDEFDRYVSTVEFLSPIIGYEESKAVGDCTDGIEGEPQVLLGAMEAVADC
jgi:hypothetical protein